MPDPYALPTFPNRPPRETTPVEGSYRQIKPPEPIPCPPDDEEEESK